MSLNGEISLNKSVLHTQITNIFKIRGTIVSGYIFFYVILSTIDG